MPRSPLTTDRVPTLPDGTMLLALTGWMDGGLVSTGTLKGIMQNRDVSEIAHIEPDPFYIYNFPGSMEVAALFRPEVKYNQGIVESFELPSNRFYADRSGPLIFFTGAEPNLRWQEFANCVFDVVEQSQIRRIIFVGSFGGTVPHTRQPRMFASVSHTSLKPLLAQHGFKFSDYEGPSSFATMLLHQSPARGIEMMSLVAEIPGYLNGANPLCIEAVTQRLAGILNIQVNLDALRKASNDWEVEVSQAVEKDAELAETVRKLQDQYDDELIGEAE